MTRSDQESAGDDFPCRGRLAGVDFGTVRIGISICDPDWILASPLEITQPRDPQTDAAYFSALIKRERIAAFVVGLPIHNDGRESEKSKLSREFARWLAAATGLPVRLFDERFTTVDARRKLAAGSAKDRKRKLDAIAAQVLLESFLEARRYHGSDVGQRIDETPQGGLAMD